MRPRRGELGVAGGVLDEAVLRELRELRDGLLEIVKRLNGFIELQQAANGGRGSRPAPTREPGRGRVRNRYYFNRAILAVLHRAGGCLPGDEIARRLDVGEDEAAGFEDAFRYLAERRVLVEEKPGCWGVRRG